MKNSAILFLFGTALFFVLRNYYREGNTGMPTPRVMGPPVYLYGILSIVSGFTGALTVPIAAGLTLALIWQSNLRDTTRTSPVTVNTSGIFVTTTPNPNTTKLPTKKVG